MQFTEKTQQLMKYKTAKYNVEEDWEINQKPV